MTTPPPELPGDAVLPDAEPARVHRESDFDSEPSEPERVAEPLPAQQVGDQREPTFTRISALWVAVGVVLAVAILLLIFILQNLQRVRVHYLGLSPSLPLGIALLIAAVAGAVVVAISGALRVLQLRRAAKRTSSN